MLREVSVLKFLEDNTKNKPNEDALYASNSKRVFAVADGVTRSVEKGGTYPNPSPASLVSRLFCIEAPLRVLQSMEESLNWNESLSEEDILAAFREGNRCIMRMNAELGITEKLDHFENDLAGCVAVIGVLDVFSRDFPLLRYGYIGDCGLLVFDKELHPVFLSSNNDLGPIELFREGMAFVGKREKMIFVRKNLRNRPRKRYMTYGVLTGEEDALAYVKTGHVLLESGDTVVLFSDGILPFIFDVQFRAALRNQLSSGGESIKLVRSIIDILTEKLSAKHVASLDDDKAFVALCMS